MRQAPIARRASRFARLKRSGAETAPSILRVAAASSSGRILGLGPQNYEYRTAFGSERPSNNSAQGCGVGEYCGVDGNPGRGDLRNKRTPQRVAWLLRME